MSESDDTPSMLKRLLMAQDRHAIDALVGGPTYDEATGQLERGPTPLTWPALVKLEEDIKRSNLGLPLTDE